MDFGGFESKRRDGWGDLGVIARGTAPPGGRTEALYGAGVARPAGGRFLSG